MNEEIDDKVDRFHKAIISRFTKNALATVAIFIILFASWYVAATYKEYDEWRFEGTWAIVRRVIIIDGQLRELNVSFGQFHPILPLSNGLNTTTMTYCDKFDKVWPPRLLGSCLLGRCPVPIPLPR